MSARTNRGTDAPTAPDPEADTCDMVSHLPLAPWTAEVFNTYGDRLTNAQLVARYGFALDGNDNDVVVFDEDDLPVPADIVATSTDRASVVPLYRRVLREVPPGCMRWAPSHLVYLPDDLGAPSAGPAVPASPDDDAPGRLRVRVALCVNSDAKVSWALWVYCAAVAVVLSRSEEAAPDARAAAAVERLAGHQLFLESNPERAMDAPAVAAGGGLEADADDDEGDNGDDGDLPRHEGTQNLDKVSELIWACVSCCCVCVFLCAVGHVFFPRCEVPLKSLIPTSPFLFG